LGYSNIIMNIYTEPALYSQLQHSLNITTKLLELQQLTRKITKIPKNVDKVEAEPEKTIEGYKLDYVPTYPELQLELCRGKVELCQHWFKQTPMLLYGDFGTDLIKSATHPKSLAWLLRTKDFVWDDIKERVMLLIHSIEFFNEYPELYSLITHAERVVLFKRLLRNLRHNTDKDNFKVLCTMLYHTTPLILENLRDKKYLHDCMFYNSFGVYHIGASLFLQDVLGKDFIDNVLFNDF